MEIPDSLLAYHIRRGAVLHSRRFADDPLIGHGKFFVVVGVYEDKVAGYFFVNSDVNRNVIKKKCQEELQFEISPKDYPFLKHMSFINATTSNCIDKRSLVEDLNNGYASFEGNIAEDLMDRIIEKCKVSDLFTDVWKERFFG